MRHSKFVFQPWDPTVRPRINTHIQASPLLYTVLLCVRMLGIVAEDAGLSGRGRRLILSRWCKQTGRAGSQRAHVQLSLWRHRVILSVPDGHLIWNRAISSLCPLSVGLLTLLTSAWPSILLITDKQAESWTPKFCHKNALRMRKNRLCASKKKMLNKMTIFLKYPCVVAPLTVRAETVLAASCLGFSVRVDSWKRWESCKHLISAVQCVFEHYWRGAVNSQVTNKVREEQSLGFHLCLHKNQGDEWRR